MDKSRKIIDIVFKTIAKLSDEEIESIINKEGKLVYIKGNQTKKKENSEDKSILDICIQLDNVSSRNDAYNILNRRNLKKDDIINIANHYEIKVLKSYTKAKIIDSIVESVVGTKLDKNAINSIDIR